MAEPLDQVTAELLRKQRELEERVARLEQAIGVSLPVAAPALHPATTPPESTRRPAMEARVGLTLVNRVGVVTLILGVAFFFKWAVDNNWIGPVARVVLGMLAGLVALGIADVLWRKQQQVFAQGITGTGIAIIYLAVYAAYGFYDLIGQAPAFLLLFGVTVLGVLLSLRYQARAIAALGLFGGYLTPLLLSSGVDHPWFLLSYVLLLNTAALALAQRRAWPALGALAMLAAALIFLSWWVRAGSTNLDSLPATLFALAYLTAFLLAGSRVVAAFAIAVAAIEVAYVWQSPPGTFFLFELLVAAGALGYAWFRRNAPAAATALIAFWICSAFAVLSLAASSSPISAAVLGVSAGFVLFRTSQAWNTAYAVFTLIFNGAMFFVLAADLLYDKHRMGLGLLAIGMAAAYVGMALVRPLLPRKTVGTSVALTEYLGAHLALLTGLALEVLEWATRSSDLLNRFSVENTAVSILIAAYALVLVAIGVMRRVPIDRVTGLALITFVILKLYLFDVWQLGRVYRIAAFVVLGLLLIGTSFLYSRFRTVIEALLKADQTPTDAPG